MITRESKKKGKVRELDSRRPLGRHPFGIIVKVKEKRRERGYFCGF